jgi:hypothetical protein
MNTLKELRLDSRRRRDFSLIHSIQTDPGILAASSIQLVAMGFFKGKITGA